MKEKSVIASLWSAGSCGRKQLAGILRYINAGHHWNVHIIMDPKDFTADVIRHATADGVDGFIAFAEEDASKALASTTLPTVLLSGATSELAARKRNLAIFVNDNDVIGRKGAEYFLSLGTFASYAFVPDPHRRDWSAPREKSFCRTLAKSGHRCLVYWGNIKDLGDWLAKLPKPIAVMTPFDFLARDVIDACKKANLSVPTQVAVIGVDNDDLVCEISRPTITSIEIDQERIGYLAARTLDELMSGKPFRQTKTILMTSGKVVERESTRPVAPGAHLVSRIQTYIEDHYREIVSLDDIAIHLGVSRRLAEIRFTESTGKTIRSALEERRLEELKRYLVRSSLPITKVSALCGFRNDLWIKYVFKRRFGMTMREFREQAKQK